MHDGLWSGQGQMCGFCGPVDDFMQTFARICRLSFRAGSRQMRFKRRHADELVRLHRMERGDEAGSERVEAVQLVQEGPLRP